LLWSLRQLLSAHRRLNLLTLGLKITQCLRCGRLSGMRSSLTLEFLECRRITPRQWSWLRFWR
jgi:hypothetical protein